MQLQPGAITDAETKQIFGLLCRRHILAVDASELAVLFAGLGCLEAVRWPRSEITCADDIDRRRFDPKIVREI